MEVLIPGVHPDRAWELVSNMQERIKIDDRFVDPEIFYEDDQSCYMYSKGKKPPIPMFS